MTRDAQFNCYGILQAWEHSFLLGKSGKTWDKSLGPSDVSCANHNKQPGDWEFQKNFKISPKKQQDILPPPLFTTGRTSLEDRPSRKGDFSIRLFVVELFALIGTAPSLDPMQKGVSLFLSYTNMNKRNSLHHMREYPQISNFLRFESHSSKCVKALVLLKIKRFLWK